jgi:RHS repeat-associated protein
MKIRGGRRNLFTASEGYRSSRPRGIGVGAGNVLTTTDATGAVTTNTYDTAGRLATTQSPNGAITSYTYDGNDQLVTTTEPGGGTTSSVYGPLGRVTSTKDQMNRTTSYLYNADGNQTKVTDPTGAFATTSYDTAGRVTATTDLAGRATTTAYDAHGRVASITAPGALVTTYTYDLLSRPKTVTSPNGGVTTTTYTPAGRTATIKDPMNLVTTYGYDVAGRQNKVTAPGNRITTTAFDGDGRVLTTTSPGGLVTTNTYDLAGRLATVTEPTGVITAQTWSKRGELLTSKRGAEGTVSYVYNPDGTLATVTDALGNATGFEYDVRGNRISRTNALAGVDSWTYNAANETTKYTDPLTRSTTITYDPAGRPLTIADPSNRTVTNTYNPDGTVATANFAIAGGASFTDAYAYDVAGRLKSVSDSVTGTVNYAYTAAGALALVRDPAGRTVTYANDAAGRRTSIRYPSGNTFNYGYDTAGRLATITPAEIVADNFVAPNGSPPGPGLTVGAAAAGTSATVQNNELAVVASASGPSPTITSNAPASTDKDITLNYRFTATTNATKLVVQTRLSATGQYRVELAANSTTGRLFKQVGATSTALGTFAVPVSTSAQYIRVIVSGTSIKVRVWADGAAQPSTFALSVTDTSVTTAGTTVMFTQFATAATPVAFGYFRDMHPTIAPSAIASYAYNLDYQVTGETLNGTTGGTRTRTFVQGRLTTYAETVPGAAISTSRTYDTTGRIATETTAGITTTFGYDTASQLLSATPSTGNTLTYTYDKLGRRATSKTGAAAAVTYGYDVASQLTSVGGTTIIYDAAGRRTSDTTSPTDKVTYAYDPAGRLAAMSRINGATTTTQNRTYTPTNLLAKVTNTTGGTTTTTGIDWDTNRNIPQPVDLVSTTPIDLVYGNTGWAATKTGATVASIGLDIDGSAIPSTGVTTARAATYDPHGIPTGTNSFEPKLGYRGELTLDNLLYLRFRDLDATRGQFTSPDPVDGYNGTPTVANTYHYGDNSPLDRIDPLGLTSDTVYSSRGFKSAPACIPAVGVGGIGGVCLAPNPPRGTAPPGTLPPPAPTFPPPTPTVSPTAQPTTPPGTRAPSPGGGGGGGRGGVVLGGLAAAVAAIVAGALARPSGGPPPTTTTTTAASKATPKPQVATGGAGARSGKTPCVSGSTVLPEPTVSDQKLQNLVTNLWKGAKNPNPTGNGTTSDAVRHERATGQPVGGTFHTIKAQETVNALTKWLTKNPNASYVDRLVAQSLLDDLLDALSCFP